jgi:YD repeat-containing protein
MPAFVRLLTGQPTTLTWDAKGNCLVENTGGSLSTS